MRLILFVILFSTVSAVSSFSQGIKVREHGNISSQMSQFQIKNKQTPFMDGWRIQIVTTDDRREMERALTQFRELYPNIPVDWTQEYPYYKVKVGAFRDKMDYYSFLLEAKENFPSALPVREKIRTEELLRS